MCLLSYVKKLDMINKDDVSVNENIDIVVTVCSNADKACPVFPGKVERIHWRIEDPFKGWGSDQDDLDNFTRTRDDLNERIKNILKNRLV